MKKHCREELHTLISISRHVCCMRAGAGPLMMQQRRRSVQERKIDNRHFGSQARASDTVSLTDTASPFQAQITSAGLPAWYVGDRYLLTI